MDIYGCTQRLGKEDQYVAIYGITLWSHCEAQYGYIRVPATVGQGGPIYCHIWDNLVGPLRGPIWIYGCTQRLNKEDQYIVIYGITLWGHCEAQYGYIRVHATAGQGGPIYCHIWDNLVGPLRGPIWIYTGARNGRARRTNMLQYMG